MKKRLLTALIPVAVCLATAGPALASTSTEEVSENWAGYEATTQSGDGYSAASGSWTVPTVTCESGEATYSAFWVGLGGGDENSDALEQEGTQSDCSASGTASYYAWYELVPSAPVKLSLKVSPGDVIYARTVVKGDEVTVKVADRTTGKTFIKTIDMTDATPDTTTAEWVAEAPSECSSGALSDCTPLPLSDFGTVKFTKAKATSDGYTGKVAHWDTTPIALEGSSSDLYGGGFGGGYSGGYPGDEGGSSGAAGSLGGYGGNTGYYYDRADWGDPYSSDSYGALEDASDDASGDAAPSSLTGDGTAFTVVYGEAPSSDAGSGTSTQGSSGTGTSSSSTGTGAGAGYGNSYGYGEGSGYGGGGYGYYSYGGGSFGGGGYGYGGGY